VTSGARDASLAGRVRERMGLLGLAENLLDASCAGGREEALEKTAAAMQSVWRGGPDF